MKYSLISRIAPVVLLLVLLCGGVYRAEATPRKQPPAKTTVKKSAPRKGAKKSKPRETSASVKRREQSVNREIQATQKQIDANEAAVKENLSILTGLEHDIEVQNRKVAQLEAGGRQIQNGIASCQRQIKEGEASLAALRKHYVAVMKKMRVARKRANPLAYIFASKSFYQAWRRMRYMSKFSDWRTRREAEIKGKIQDLAQLDKRLEVSEKELSVNLSRQQQARRELAAKHAAQDATVKELRAQGDALHKHLAQKQAEANALSAQIVSLIAQEQELARLAERQRAEEQARAKAEAERKAAERAAAERAAAERAAAEKAAAEKAAAEQAARDKQLAQNKDKKKDKKKDKPKDNKSKDKKEKRKVEPQPSQSTRQQSGKDYAEARNRKPRRGSDSDKPAPAPKPTPAPAPKATSSSAASSGFAASKGSLPRPATGGQFSIYSHFGRHSLPDLPDVMYDNPGIDAVVAKGASAQAVYPGTVTGMYVLPGFSTVVIVSHGDYYTVYGNIGTPAVSKGEKVKQGQALGKLVSDPDQGGRTTIHFEIYKNRVKQNPESWIR